MTTRKLFELFVKNNTKGRDGITPNANFKRTYGDISFEQAFESYLTNVNDFFSLKKKVAKRSRAISQKVDITTTEELNIALAATYILRDQ